MLAGGLGARPLHSSDLARLLLGRASGAIWCSSQYSRMKRPSARQVHLTPGGKKLLNVLAARHRDELLRLQGIFRVPGADELAAHSQPDDPG